MPSPFPSFRTVQSIRSDDEDHHQQHNNDTEATTLLLLRGTKSARACKIACAKTPRNSVIVQHNKNSAFYVRTVRRERRDFYGSACREWPDRGRRVKIVHAQRIAVFLCVAYIVHVFRCHQKIGHEKLCGVKWWCQQDEYRTESFGGNISIARWRLC
jgi:hypothetical protein